MKWLWVVLLILLAFWAGGHLARSNASAEARALADTATTLRSAAHEQRAVLTASLLVVDSLDRVLTSVAQVAAEARRIVDSAVAHWDTVWVGTDTLPLAEVRRRGDVAIAACQRAVTTCEVRVAKERERGDGLRGAISTADSLARTWQEAADAHQKEADAWRRVARGPLLRLSVDGLLNPGDGDWQAAGDATVGRGALKALARLQVGAPSGTSWWFGGRYEF